MRKILLIVAILVASACNSSYVIHAQTLPYTLVVGWDAPTTAATGFNCYLDNVLAASVSSGTTLTCSFPVATTGPHVIAVTTVNTNSIPQESSKTETCSGGLIVVPAGGCSFILQAPSVPTNVRAR